MIFNFYMQSENLNDVCVCVCTQPGLRDRDYWTWQQIQALEVENIADTPSFVFLW